jgi:hypothetical protein
MPGTAHGAEAKLQPAVRGRVKDGFRVGRDSMKATNGVSEVAEPDTTQASGTQVDVGLPRLVSHTIKTNGLTTSSST